jgi:hypothetical protein
MLLIVSSAVDHRTYECHTNERSKSSVASHQTYRKKIEPTTMGHSGFDFLGVIRRAFQQDDAGTGVQGDVKPAERKRAGVGNLIADPVNGHDDLRHGRVDLSRRHMTRRAISRAP